VILLRFIFYLINKFILSAAAAEPIKKKKKKKNPVPKDFQPDFVPDPERWIPLRER